MLHFLADSLLVALAVILFGLMMVTFAAYVVAFLLWRDSHVCCFCRQQARRGVGAQRLLWSGEPHLADIVLSYRLHTVCLPSFQKCPAL